jgi:hypothetical protein
MLIPLEALTGFASETMIQEYFGSAPRALAARSGSTTALNAIIGKPGNSRTAKRRLPPRPCLEIV